MAVSWRKQTCASSTRSSSPAALSAGCDKKPDPPPPSEVVAAKPISSADRAAAEAKSSADKKAAADTQAAAFAAAKLKVKRKSWGSSPDGDCTGKGLPPYRISYEGGTYDEDEMVAVADGCSHLYERRNTMNDSTFCCPK